MRHRVAYRKLGRVTEHRISMLRNQATALLRYEHLETTVPKAKELRPFVEKILTCAKKAALANDGTKEGKIKALHYIRLAESKLGPMAGTGVYDKKNELVPVNETVMKKLINELGPRFKDRPGGYTRILKLHTRRLGDAGEQAIIELLKEGEVKPKKERPTPVAPAPTPVAAS